MSITNSDTSNNRSLSPTTELGVVLGRINSGGASPSRPGTTGQNSSVSGSVHSETLNVGAELVTMDSEGDWDKNKMSTATPGSGSGGILKPPAAAKAPVSSSAGKATKAGTGTGTGTSSSATRTSLGQLMGFPVSDLGAGSSLSSAPDSARRSLGMSATSEFTGSFSGQISSAGSPDGGISLSPHGSNVNSALIRGGTGMKSSSPSLTGPPKHRKDTLAGGLSESGTFEESDEEDEEEEELTTLLEAKFLPKKESLSALVTLRREMAESRSAREELKLKVEEAAVLVTNHHSTHALENVTLARRVEDMGEENQKHMGEVRALERDVDVAECEWTRLREINESLLKGIQEKEMEKERVKAKLASFTVCERAMIKFTGQVECSFQGLELRKDAVVGRTQRLKGKSGARHATLMALEQELIDLRLEAKTLKNRLQQVSSESVSLSSQEREQLERLSMQQEPNYEHLLHSCKHPECVKVRRVLREAQGRLDLLKDSERLLPAVSADSSVAEQSLGVSGRSSSVLNGKSEVGKKVTRSRAQTTLEAPVSAHLSIGGGLTPITLEPTPHTPNTLATPLATPTPVQRQGTMKPTYR